ncbi:MAG: pyridoxamine 5'-phosphate oxidase family protein [Patescibacteria group bacterium]
MNEEARTILQENILGTVATLNEDGSPWSTPVHVFSDDEAVYWFSHETAQHSINVEKDPRVSLTLFSPDVSRGPKSVYINGSVTKLGVEETTEAKNLMVAKIGKIPDFYAQATAYRLPIGEINRGKSYGNCWYFYT